MKIKKNYFYIGVTAVIVILAFIVLLSFSGIKQPQENGEKQENEALWQVDESGYLSYPLDRGNVRFSRSEYGVDGNLTIHKIIYQSKDGNIYGFLVLPTTAPELLPGIIFLPGAGVSKESKLELAKQIAWLDAVVLVVDQRGTGETTAQLNPLEQDYAGFLSNKEPTQHLMVYDALRAYDLLHNAPFVDRDRIAFVGESLGGRIAIIAAALDRNVEGVLAISSSGFDFEETNNTKINSFLKSIDPNHYLEMLTPRKLAMMHNVNDQIVPLDAAIRTYSKAQEPKKFVLVNDTGCNHGYCDSMQDGLASALDYLVEIRSKTLIEVPAG